MIDAIIHAALERLDAHTALIDSVRLELVAGSSIDLESARERLRTARAGMQLERGNAGALVVFALAGVDGAEMIDRAIAVCDRLLAEFDEGERLMVAWRERERSQWVRN